MKYLLFIKFNSGLMHNNIYDTLNALHESIAQLVEEEGLKTKIEEFPDISKMQRHLQKDDDYFKELSNGSWYHVQPYPIFG